MRIWYSRSGKDAVEKLVQHGNIEVEFHRIRLLPIAVCMTQTMVPETEDGGVTRDGDHLRPSSAHSRTDLIMVP